MHTCLGQCPQLLFRYKRKKLDTLLFFFDVLANLTARLDGMSFFQMCVRFLFSSVRVRSVMKKFAIVFQNWFHHERMVCGVFSRNVPHFVVVISAWTTSCQKSTSVFFFGGHQVNLMQNIMVVLICCSNVTVLFRHWIFQDRLMSFIHAIQPYFLKFCVIQPFFHARSDD